MRKVPVIERERHYEFEWKGPYLLRNGMLRGHPAENCPLPPAKPGIYILTGDHPLHGNHSLLYIGKTQNFLQHRIKEHKWFKEEWRVEVFVALVEGKNVRSDAEKLLIYAHSPLYNAAHIAEPPRPKPPLRIWNVGRYWGLFPEVSSEHDWYLPYD